MDRIKTYRTKSLGVVCTCALLAAAGLSTGLYYILGWVNTTYLGQGGTEALNTALPMAEHYLKWGITHFYTWVVPSVCGVALVLGLIFWALLGAVVAPVLKPRESDTPKVSKKGKKDFLAQKMEQERKRRLFLHTLSVLQREGRLLDFFAEDLGQYEDDQIGAAVRSIQDDCKKAVKKYINPVPVIDKEEGDRVTIEPGFDMDAIALVGNVTGEPPFEGVLRHPGWKAAKKELPKLSDIQDPGIMVPAEVEIQ